jgi:hypothetical protein
MAQDWDIKSRSECCRRCNAEFADGQVFISALSFGEEGYSRADYHEACWSEGTGGAPVPFSVWRGVFRLPPPPAEEPLKRETAESLLRKLMEKEDPSQRYAIYILAVMLERKRIFAERGVEQREDGLTIRVYEHKKTKETFLVPEPHLRLDQLEEVQTQVLALLGGSKSGDATTPDAAAPAPAALPDPAVAPAADAPTPADIGQSSPAASGA